MGIEEERISVAKSQFHRDEYLMRRQMHLEIIYGKSCRITSKAASERTRQRHKSDSEGATKAAQFSMQQQDQLRWSEMQSH